MLLAEPREAPIDAVRREVREENGLQLEATPRLAYSRTRDGEGQRWTVTIFDCDAAGTPVPDDPDGPVRRAARVSEQEALERLDRLPWYDTAPLRRWLAED